MPGISARVAGTISYLTVWSHDFPALVFVQICRKGKGRGGKKRRVKRKQPNKKGVVSCGELAAGNNI
eukprot:2801015-Rhodomonas_salina.1